MSLEDHVSKFQESLKENPDLPMAVNAVRILLESITQSKATTMMELRGELKSLIDTLIKSTSFTLSLSSGCELFMHFVTRTSVHAENIEEAKQHLQNRANTFMDKASDSRRKIAQLGLPFIRDGATILIHSRSRVVERLLLDVVAQNRRINVYMTESRPDNSGYAAASQLINAGIPVTMILDAAVGHIMGKVDLVLVGAEGVVESGGIVNKIGTYQLAIVAKAANKPLYVFAESFKFVRLFPLDQYDLPPQSINPEPFPTPTDALIPSGVNYYYPLVDYTPPSYISLLFTDLGVLTPSAVSDELIKLYY